LCKLNNPYERKQIRIKNGLEEDEEESIFTDSGIILDPTINVINK